MTTSSLAPTPSLVPASVSHFDHTFTVRASLGAVAQFHHDTRALARLTPPPILVQLHRIEPLAEGSVSEFTLWFGPLPIRWKAVHSRVDAEHGFTDTQHAGPMQFWQHTHRFESAEAGVTQVHEHIDYRHAAGWRGGLSRLLFNPLALRGLFLYREWVTRAALERSRA